MLKKILKFLLIFQNWKNKCGYVVFTVSFLKSRFGLFSSPVFYCLTHQPHLLTLEKLLAVFQQAPRLSLLDIAFTAFGRHHTNKVDVEGTVDIFGL